MQNISDIVAALQEPSRRISIAAENRYVYMLFSGGETVYVGFTASLNKRLVAHKSNGSKIEFDSYSYLTFTDHAEALNVERQLILLLRPKYNSVIAKSEYTGTPEERKEAELAKHHASREKRAARMLRNEITRAESWLNSSQENRDRWCEMVTVPTLGSNPHLSRETVVRDFYREMEELVIKHVPDANRKHLQPPTKPFCVTKTQ
jgi:predicted GIY-YIG superfamily endonuclease